MFSMELQKIEQYVVGLVNCIDNLKGTCNDNNIAQHFPVKRYALIVLLSMLKQVNRPITFRNYCESLFRHIRQMKELSMGHLEWKEWHDLLDGYMNDYKKCYVR